MRQVHTDWFPGLDKVIKKYWPSARPCQGVEHLLRALRKKHAATENGKRVRVPKLRSRQKMLPHMLHSLALLPTKASFEACLKHFMDRAEHGWNEPKWAKYFRSRYLFRKTARWWYGVRSGMVPGHPPSQQQPEQSHRQMKRILTDRRCTLPEARLKSQSLCGFSHCFKASPGETLESEYEAI